MYLGNLHLQHGSQLSATGGLRAHRQPEQNPLSSAFWLWVILGKLPNLSVSPFSYLFNGDDTPMPS